MANNCEEYVLEQLEKKDVEIEMLKKAKENLILENESLKRERRDLLIVARVFANARANELDGLSFTFDEKANIPPFVKHDVVRANEIINEIDFVKERDFINGKN